MAAFRKHIYVLRLVAIIAGGAFLGACMKWKTESLQPERFRTADSAQTLRLSLTSGDTLIVYGPVIAGDSLVAMREFPDSAPRRVSVPLATISQAEVRKQDVANSPGAAIGVLILGMLIYAAATHPCYAF